MRWLLRRSVSKTARRILINRTLTDVEGHQFRWLDTEIDHLISQVEADVAALRDMADLDGLSSFGNQVMVEMAIYTAAADRTLRNAGLDPELVTEVVADLGWDIYRRLLRANSAPVRWVTKDPGRRLRWTIRLLLRFPFSAPGAPGYEVTAAQEGDTYLTYFKHCPPQSFARRLSCESDDPRVLETFRRSWCTYDWPGADLIADDGTRGHYGRSQTLSHGDPVCDMCWAGRVNKNGSEPRASSGQARPKRDTPSASG